jgi:hypothetical protein
MKAQIELKLDAVNGRRENRMIAADFILDNSLLFSELIALCFDLSNKNASKGCWVLEFVSYKKLEWFSPHLEFLFSNLKNLTHESAIRPLAKVCQLLVKSHYRKDENSIVLSQEQLQHCVSVNFDWLIQDSKVATKAYAIRTLYILGKDFDWIHPELRIILAKEYSTHSAAYKAVAREVLKKLR